LVHGPGEGFGFPRAAYLGAPSARRAQPQVRFRGEVDMNRQARLAGSVDNDPKLL